MSWVIIPVYLPTPLVGDDTAAADPAEVRDAGAAVKAEADTEMEASSFRTIWRVLRALAAHDARVVGRITELRAHRAQPAPLTTDAVDGEGAETGTAGEQPPAPVESPIDWLRIDARRHAARILQTVKLRAFNPRATEWQRMHAVAARFHLEHGHLDPTDREKHGELISWLDRQRYLNGQGLFDAVRVSELDALGMIWSKHANAPTVDLQTATTRPAKRGQPITRWSIRKPPPWPSSPSGAPGSLLLNVVGDASRVAWSRSAAGSPRPTRCRPGIGAGGVVWVAVRPPSRRRCTAPEEASAVRLRPAPLDPAALRPHRAASAPPAFFEGRQAPARAEGPRVFWSLFRSSMVVLCLGVREVLAGPRPRVAVSPRWSGTRSAGFG
ncbi:helicase associated domain-containing protein [Kitasatospora aureofaciens]|uniref:helicase associated domain-containing protein n=1 Tax=Kitasatospora aureofaciens TaxID=1894 RepID=UPI0033ED4C9D